MTNLGHGSQRPGMQASLVDATLVGLATRACIGPPSDADWGGDSPPDGTLVVRLDGPALYLRANGQFYYWPFATPNGQADLRGLTVSTGALMVGGASSLAGYRTATYAWPNPAPYGLGPGESAERSFGWSEARVGDTALVSLRYRRDGHDSGDLQGCLLGATVERDRLLTVRLWNPGAAGTEPCDFPSLTLRVDLIQH